MLVGERSKRRRWTTGVPKRQTEGGESDRVVRLKWRRLGVVGADGDAPFYRRPEWSSNIGVLTARIGSGRVMARGMAVASIEMALVTGQRYDVRCVDDDPMRRAKRWRIVEARVGVS